VSRGAEEQRSRGAEEQRYQRRYEHRCQQRYQQRCQHRCQHRGQVTLYMPLAERYCLFTMRCTEQSRGWIVRATRAERCPTQSQSQITCEGIGQETAAVTKYPRFSFYPKKVERKTFYEQRNTTIKTWFDGQETRCQCPFC
jgi:hypothetical protein